MLPNRDTSEVRVRNSFKKVLSVTVSEIMARRRLIDQGSAVRIPAIGSLTTSTTSRRLLHYVQMTVKKCDEELVENVPNAIL